MYFLESPQPKLMVLQLELADNEVHHGYEAYERFKQIVILGLLFEEFCIEAQDPDKFIDSKGIPFPLYNPIRVFSDHFFKKDWKVRKDAELIMGYVSETSFMSVINRVAGPAFEEHFGHDIPDASLSFMGAPGVYDALLTKEDGVRVYAKDLINQILAQGKLKYINQVHKDLESIRRNSNYGCLCTSPHGPAPFQPFTGVTPKAPSPGIVLSLLSHAYDSKDPWKSLVSEEAAALFCLAAYLEDNLACTQIISPRLYSDIKDKTDVKVLFKDADLTMHQFLNRYYDKFSMTVPKCSVTYPVESTLGMILIKIIQYMRGMLPNHVPGEAFLGFNSDGGDLEFANQGYRPESGGVTLSASLMVYIIREVIYKGLWALYNNSGQLYSLMGNAPGCLTVGYTMDYIEKMRVLNEYQAAFALQQLN